MTKGKIYQFYIIVVVILLEPNIILCEREKHQLHAKTSKARV